MHSVHPSGIVMPLGAVQRYTFTPACSEKERTLKKAQNTFPITLLAFNE